MTSEITMDGVVLNGVTFGCGVPVDAYLEVLGQPTRSLMPGPPPSYGHRNNILYFYDELGILLREHHASRLIDGLDVLLDPPRWHFPTTRSYTGELHVCGVRVHAGMAFGDFARQTEIQFHPHLGHAWIVDGEKVSIQFEVFRNRQSKAKVESIVAVLVGFARAHQVGNRPS